MMKRNVCEVVEVVQRVSRAKKGPTDRDLRILYRVLHKFFNMEGKLYYSFNGVIQLGQFLTLGVVLVGLLARVHCIYRELYEQYGDKFIELGCVKLPKYNTKLEEHVPMDTDEVGELIEESEILGSTEEIIDKPEPKIEKKKDKDDKKKKKKKKKKSSAIDDIFG